MKKREENILNIYHIKMQEYHGKMFNYNEDFKNFVSDDSISFLKSFFM